jgi:hypothetical protein
MIEEVMKKKVMEGKERKGYKYKTEKGAEKLVNSNIIRPTDLYITSH